MEREDFIAALGVDAFQDISFSKKTKEALLNRNNCYEIACRITIENDGFMLCHGWPVGQGGPIEGMRYGHAWCEKIHDIALPKGVPEDMFATMASARVTDGQIFMPVRMVYDFTAPDIELCHIPAQLYYYAGGIDPRQVTRIDKMDTYDLLNQAEHWGPFHEPPEAYLEELEKTSALARNGEVTCVTTKVTPVSDEDAAEILRGASSE